MYAFPYGIPGGWSNNRKIHIVAHSQGAPTVRYLQYLLSIDYFNDGSRVKEDRSDWIASLTCLSGCNNGAPTSAGLNIDAKTSKFKSIKSHGIQDAGLWSTLVMFGVSGVVVNNFLQGPMNGKLPGSVTNDMEFESRNKAIKTGVTLRRATDGKQVEEIIYEIGPQNRVLHDLNLETYGLNWQTGNETFAGYVKRVCKHNAIYDTKHTGIHEFPF